jgi:PPE-repeat protein
MDFGALPPEVNSDRMYVDPASATLLAASEGWQGLAADLYGAASSYQSVVSGLIDESWVGPLSMSMSMLAAVTPYLQWMWTAAAQCEEAATRATAAAAAYETAFAMTVPPPTVVANRIRLATLIATNFLGQNTPAIAATEAEYPEMWAQDAAAMNNYAVSSATASTFKTFMSPPQTANPSGFAAHAGAVIRAASTKAQTTSAQLISSVPQALKSLATPGASSSAGISQAAMGSAASLGSSAASAPVGLGSDSAGFGADAGGLGFDSYGLSPDFHSAGSIWGLGAARTQPHRRAWVMRTCSVPCRCRRVGPTRCQWIHRRPYSTPTSCPAGGARRRRPELAPSPRRRWGPWPGVRPGVRFAGLGSAP